MSENYTGISFPFRVNNQGKVVLSSMDGMSAKHLDESIEQILHTEFGERVMEESIYSDVVASLFKPNDISLQSYLASRIVSALSVDSRIIVNENGISFSTQEGYLYATIKYKTRYNNNTYQTDVNIGEVME